MRDLRFLPQEIISAETGNEILELVVLCLMLMNHHLLILLPHLLRFKHLFLWTCASPFL
ncbi:E1A 6 kDa protein [Human mastadenovirus B]|uniref:Early E1A protein n=2 Tax=Human mastadenovirus B TaxID=108098 RepID=Q5UW23_9ADEN|nr:E1A 6.5 kDa protein [Human adenovirus 11]AAU09036.1 E1A 6.5 kDa protein [Human mastadenovirus B]WPC86513.1 6.5 kDa protein [Human adenovirus 34]AAP49216.1 58 R [Human adenovirus 11]AGT75574.1 E1A 6 kDa protein [Human mastadenovirus B]